MLNSFEYELVNKEYIRCLHLIREYSNRGQKCILFKLRSFECLINKTLYNTILRNLQLQLENDHYEVYLHNTELLIFWDKRFEAMSTAQNNLNNIAGISRKGKKKNDENILIEHTNLQIGEYVDSFPIKTGKY